MSKEYNIGIYIRLSMADEDTGYGSKAESDSIGNQRMLINRFLDNHPELSHCQRSEFADDGYTGTNFHRPQFTQMMEKVKRGEIDLICVKDFSRFSRDYIETGNYLECTFPFMGCLLYTSFGANFKNQFSPLSAGDGFRLEGHAFYNLLYETTGITRRPTGKNIHSG